MTIEFQLPGCRESFSLSAATTREELIEQAEQFLVGRSLIEYLPELMADFHIEMKKSIKRKEH